MQLRALDDRVILKVEKKEEEQKTASGLVLLSENENENNLAEVVAVGPGFTTPSGKLIPIDVKVGDTVIYNPMAVREAEFDGEEYLITFSKDILAVVTGEK